MARLQIAFVLGIFLFITGCDVQKGSLPDQLLQALNRAVVWIAGSSSENTTPTPNKSMTAEEYTSAAAKNAKANAEILREMLQVIMDREPKDHAEFGNWVDTLNQGASLEGVYNGLTHSADYRKMEVTHPGATIDALKLFGEELAYLEIELPVATQFDSLSASPLPLSGAAEQVPQKVMEIDQVVVTEAKQDIRPLAEKYSKTFVGASNFTLKRVLGDEALKVIAKKLEYREKLALWYSKWAVRTNQRGIDFGISLRNKSDEAFHYKWVLDTVASGREDRIKWEVLNRLHRLLNEANKTRQ